VNSKVLNNAFGAYHLHEKKCTNSMDWATSIAFKVPHGTLCTADTHDSVRGRHARVWTQHPEQLLLTYIAERPSSATIESLMMAVALSVYTAINQSAPGVSIKWPNDICYHGKKIAGILTKTVTYQNATRVIIGIGINIGDTLPQEIASIATSIWKVSQDKKTTKESLTHQMSNSFNFFYNDLLNNNSQRLSIEWLAARKASTRDQTFHLNSGEIITGIITSYLPNGALVVQDCTTTNYVILSFIDVISVLDK